MVTVTPGSKLYHISRHTLTDKDLYGLTYNDYTFQSDRHRSSAIFLYLKGYFDTQTLPSQNPDTWDLTGTFHTPAFVQLLDELVLAGIEVVVID